MSSSNSASRANPATTTNAASTTTTTTTTATASSRRRVRTIFLLPYLLLPFPLSSYQLPLNQSPPPFFPLFFFSHFLLTFNIKNLISLYLPSTIHIVLGSILATKIRRSARAEANLARRFRGRAQGQFRGTGSARGVFGRVVEFVC